MVNPMKEIHFCPLMFPRRFCQKPRNQAAGMDTSVDPNEYGSDAIPASKGDIPLTA